MVVLKSFFGVLILFLFVGCGSSTPTVEPTLENTPWLFPEPQIELLKSEDYRVRGLAAQNLAKMGAKAKAAIPILEELLKDEKEPKLRILLEKTLTKIREGADDNT